MTAHSNQPPRPALCQVHKIPLGPDGRCIQCQREYELGQMAQSRSGYQIFVSFLTVLLVLGGCAAVGYFFVWPWYQRWEKEQALALVMEGPWEGQQASGDDAGTRKSRWSRPTYRKRQRPPVRRSNKASVHAPTRKQRQIRSSIRSPFNKPTVKIIKPGEESGRISGVAAASRRARVVVYVTSWCPACRKARRWLKRKNVRHTIYDVQRNRTAMMELRSLNPRGSIPTFKIGRQVLVGFSSAAVTRAIYRAAR